MDIKGLFENMSFEVIEPIRYIPKGRYKVKLFYRFYERVGNSNQLIDDFNYNTEQEREQKINESLLAHGYLAEKYHTGICALKVDGQYWNISRLANTCENIANKQY